METPAHDSPGFVLGSDDGDPYWWLGSLTITKVSSRVTHGGLSIVDHRVPAGYAPPKHVHHGQDETFFILEGQFTVSCGDDQWQAGPGSLVFLPRDVPHGFTVSDAGAGRTLLINTPGDFDGLISELGDPAQSLTLPPEDLPMPAPERAKALAEAHGIFSA